jgi:hypothetical protein
VADDDSGLPAVARANPVLGLDFAAVAEIFDRRIVHETPAAAATST